jgi:hypothetical protein
MHPRYFLKIELGWVSENLIQVCSSLKMPDKLRQLYSMQFDGTDIISPATSMSFSGIKHHVLLE